MRFLAILPFIAGVAMAVPHPGTDAVQKSCVGVGAKCSNATPSNFTMIPDQKFCCPWLVCGADNTCQRK
ncbi:hypothetical protein ASPWEDRAFT_176303 [Aspergillus wentii DTO 134E9]|uniref:Long chronological lifespan protein 2 n=1 Tax=Aspergillus wentii DTO 134E9 TaxID=1073089 RepID=A0A1L9R8H5_ASPWE|nr:uncharacterized protein ASPWEDRAFT_176303 [Aspergillus wentii DTO 134E9]KAI9925038.1 hypothetical protein MW887_006445 [Aspergillus wentii]OJJ31211.1 hypothetical protein ASPWEDRAFT_176303 [Aspergillus wentii DTO 134E9]